jgi:hypothetical protein
MNGISIAIAQFLRPPSADRAPVAATWSAVRQPATVQTRYTILDRDLQLLERRSSSGSLKLARALAILPAASGLERA